MKTITKIALVLILVMAFDTSAQMNIVCEESVYVGSEFSVAIMRDGIPATSGIAVLFTSQNGDELYKITDIDGMVSHLSYSTGLLHVEVVDGTHTIETLIMVVDEPWVPDTDTDVYYPPVEVDTPEPDVTPTEEPRVSVTPASIVTIPVITINDTVNVTVNDTVNDTVPDVVPTQTIEPVIPTPEPTVVETAEEAEDVYYGTTEKKSLPREPESPGFGGIVVIGILGIVYFLRR